MHSLNNIQIISFQLNVVRHAIYPKNENILSVFSINRANKVLHFTGNMLKLIEKKKYNSQRRPKGDSSVMLSERSSWIKRTFNEHLFLEHPRPRREKCVKEGTVLTQLNTRQ